MINRAFSVLGRNFALYLVPLVMDLASFLLGLMTRGFWGQSKLTFKFALNVGLPSISNVLDQNVTASGLNFTGGDTGLGAAALLLFVVFFIAGAFIEAGFIGLLFEAAAKDQSPSMELFMDYAGRFWGRFLVLRLIFLGVTVLGMLLAIPFMIFGIVAFIVIFLILRIKYIYWEFTIVSEDLSVSESFSRSREHYENRTPELASVILVILGANFLAGLVFNFFWNPLAILLGIFVYSYAATGLQLALMYTKPGLPDLPPPVPVQ